MRFDYRFRALLVLGMLGCSRHPASCVAGQVFSPPAPASSAEVEKILETDLEDDAGDDAGQSFVELVRRDAWDEAFTVLQALPEEKKRKPAVRLVTARVAMARSDYETARDALVGLEKELTPIADDIERWTAEAEAHVGPYEPAARYFAKQASSKNLARAAIAFDKAGLAAEAGSAADRAIAHGQGKVTRARCRCARCERGSPKQRGKTQAPQTTSVSSCSRRQRAMRPNSPWPPSRGSILRVRSPAKND